jgi:hypothetical protein
MSENLEMLKQEAKELGITHSANIKESTLQEKIDAYYEAQESSGKEIEKAVKAVEAANAKEKSEEKPVVSGTKKKPMALRAKEIYDKAKQTVVVTIIDNDQRVNNQTTTCKANWSNAYYDMGTRLFPLNTPVEVPKGFIQVLKEVKIPHHIRDNKTGLASTSMRNRYTISYEQ